jgi:hypothetical protein
MQRPRPRAGAGGPGARDLARQQNRFSNSRPALRLQRLRKLPSLRRLIHHCSVARCAITPDKALALTAAERDKLAAILARLASPYDGEIIAAAAALQRLLAARSLTIRDVLEPPALPAVAPPQPAFFDVLQDWPTRWRAAVHFCQSVPATLLTPWERQFLANLARYRHQPSTPQLDILAIVVARIMGEDGAP